MFLLFRHHVFAWLLIAMNEHHSVLHHWRLITKVTSCITVNAMLSASKFYSKQLSSCGCFYEAISPSLYLVMDGIEYWGLHQCYIDGWHGCRCFEAVWTDNVFMRPFEKRSYYAVAMSIRPSVLLSFRPSFRTSYQYDLRYQFQTWNIHSVGGTTCRVWVSSKSSHSDLLYS